MARVGFLYRKLLNGLNLMPKVVMTFPGGRHKVLTMSYDDARAADRRLVEAFNTFGIKGTFHINSGLFEKERGQDSRKRSG